MGLVPRTLLHQILCCPELADCAPEDKDPDTQAVEREVRALLLSGFVLNAAAPAPQPASVKSEGNRTCKEGL